jgi:hypothetical protein
VLATVLGAVLPMVVTFLLGFAAAWPDPTKHFFHGSSTSFFPRVKGTETTDEKHSIYPHTKLAVHAGNPPQSLRVSLVSHPKEIADLILMAAGRKKSQ